MYARVWWIAFFDTRFVTTTRTSENMNVDERLMKNATALLLFLDVGMIWDVIMMLG